MPYRYSLTRAAIGELWGYARPPFASGRLIYQKKEPCMFYPIKTSNGHAGEFFFAYKIANLFHWPCRLMDIDIGIDAQVEIMNEDTRVSTGQFVAFQIKASEKEGQTYIYTTKAHLQYWKTLELPVFVVLVDLSKKKIYLHEVDLNHKYHVTGEGRIRIDFDLAKDSLKKSCAQKIVQAGRRKAEKQVSEAVAEINAYSRGILKMIKEVDEHADPEGLLDLMHQRNDYKARLEHACGLAKGLHAGENFVEGARQRIDEALEELKTFMQNSHMLIDWNDDGSVTAFVNEH